MNAKITTQTRYEGIAAAVETAKKLVAEGKGVSASIIWKGTELVLPVASVDLDLVLLNPHSHRIGAQLQSLPQGVQDTVSADPFGVEAQATIAQVLSETPGFEQIKHVLDNEGQLHHGVITDKGVLINANTRAVALRQLHVGYLKVIVLPDDAGTKEIVDLELLLQMQQDVKQDYSFPSQALFVEDLINNHFTVLQVGRRIRPDLTNSNVDKKKASDLVELELRLLGLMREVREASAGAVTWTFFDDKRQALIEIDEDYQKLKNTKPEEAARIRDAQLAGMIAGVDYRKLREVDTTLLDDYVEAALRESDLLGPHVDALLTPGATDSATDLPGLDLLDDAAPPSGVSLSPLYLLLATASAQESVSLPTTEGTAVDVPRKAVESSLYSALTTAIENKQRDNRRLDDLTAPMVHLREAAKSIDKAVTTYADVRRRAEFDESAFGAALRSYQRAAAELDAIATDTSDAADV
ncbi:hypothetical protein GCM10009616_34480 [Microlunatus lacustris]